MASEIVNDGWRRWAGPDAVPEVSAREAGVILAEIASAHRLTFFAHYSTDTAGHRGGMDGSVGALERVDTFLAGVLDRLPANRTLMVVSDHGNIEDVRGGHTRNPALGLLVGPEARERARELDGLGDIAPRALDWLSA
ncbi:MAG: alkaline phosphatase family protein [Gemmatimonadetes bacterium]|nr:alkaline phosphatase family protein [Gemmatimonadota bacterium]